MTFINKTNHQKIIIPDHGSEKIGYGLLNKIIKKDLGLTREEFLELL
jgi:predicted RNA binding protein YcfA (HicA-like mRNA interferase family)